LVRVSNLRRGFLTRFRGRRKKILGACFDHARARARGRERTRKHEDHKKPEPQNHLSTKAAKEEAARLFLRRSCRV